MQQESTTHWNEPDLDLSGKVLLDSDDLALITEYQGPFLKLGIRELELKVASIIASLDCGVEFVSLPSIGLEQARLLKKYRGNYLGFPALQSIGTNALSTLLSEFHGTLDLGFQELGEGNAKTLCESDLSVIVFSGLTTMNIFDAKYLNQSDSILDFGRLDSLSAEVAHALLNGFTHPVSFECLEIADAKLAAAIATHSHELFLHGVKELAGDVAHALLQHRGEFIGLTGLKHCSINVSEAIATSTVGKKKPQTIWLGVESIDAKLAYILGKTSCGLYFTQLGSMPIEVAEVFAQSNCHWLGFNESLQISDQAKEALYKFPRDLNLRDQITHISV